MRLRFVASEEKDSLKQDRRQLDEIKGELDQLRKSKSPVQPPQHEGAQYSQHQASALHGISLGEEAVSLSLDCVFFEKI